jgi:hypothetical protein
MNVQCDLYFVGHIYMLKIFPLFLLVIDDITHSMFLQLVNRINELYKNSDSFWKSEIVLSSLINIKSITHTSVSILDLFIIIMITV